jgi:hypothetical protein
MNQQSDLKQELIILEVNNMTKKIHKEDNSKDNKASMFLFFHNVKSFRCILTNTFISERLVEFDLIKTHHWSSVKRLSGLDFSLLKRIHAQDVFSVYELSHISLL